MTKTIHNPSWILPTIVVSQFFCTSLWFSGNAVMNDLIKAYALDINALAHLTSAVQLGFILGTLLFAILTIADRFSPSKVFFVSAQIAMMCNLAIIWSENTFISLLSFRFLTGFFLAGIYPVGMKIAADYYDKRLGKSLGYLVGALVLGTAFPHLLKEFTTDLPWRAVLIITSIVACLGGVLMLLFVKDGPYRKQSHAIDFLTVFKVFSNKEFKKAAFGYFGHMWELYTFWAFVPIIISVYKKFHPEASLNVAVGSFIIIGIGAIACILSGYISIKKGAQKTATIALLLSCICCLISPLFFKISSEFVFMVFLSFWGMVVIADSPLFSTLVAQNVQPSFKGTALTIVNCIGFAITIISIQLLTAMIDYIDIRYIFPLLGIGPILGLIIILKKN